MFLIIFFFLIFFQKIVLLAILQTPLACGSHHASNGRTFTAQRTTPQLPWALITPHKTN